MSAPLETLTRMTEALTACSQEALPQRELIALWRSGAATLALPQAYGQVLGDLLDRMEASALFSGDSCSFSQQDLFEHLQLWADQARAKLSPP